MTTDRVKIANLPTPLHRLERLSKLWHGDIWIKRDDLTESGLSGNKVRKLEYLIADARNQGADTLISCGGIQSNHCRATALAAARFGFKCWLLLRGDPPSEIDGNLLLNHLTGAKIDYIDSDSYHSSVQQHLESLANQAVVEGLKPYIIPEGGSNPIGAQGYIDAANEAARQCEEFKLKPKRIVCATGSGGTHAGLWLGVTLGNWQVDVISIAVCYSADETILRIKAIIDETISKFDLNINCKLDDIKVLDGYIGRGYARADDDVYRTITEAARLEGILVDPVYTGKAIRAVKMEIELGNFLNTTLFWHTGGVYGLFPFRQELNGFLGRQSEQFLQDGKDRQDNY